MHNLALALAERGDTVITGATMPFLNLLAVVWRQPESFQKRKAGSQKRVRRISML